MLITEKVKLWRSRFYGRQDVYGKKTTFIDKKTGKPVTQYMTEYRDKTGTTIAERCYSLEDSHIEAHIRGAIEIIIYVLHTDNTVRFAAVDFDTRHTFDDALKLKTIIMTEHGFPCAIARSTRKGYHLYMFFDRSIEASYVTSYISHVYEQIGWMEDLRQGVKALPETFPKTIMLRDELALGYPIKPPMHETGMMNDRTCWVDDNDIPIGGKGISEEQWEYFASIPLIAVDSFKEFIADHYIQVDSIRISEKRGAVPQTEYRRTTKYEPPKDGDFYRVVQGCPSMKKVWYDIPKGQADHHAYVAALSWALQCANGLDAITDFWKDENGEVSDYCKNQIRHGMETYQQPWTCRAMQEHGICVKGRDPRHASGNSLDSLGRPLTDYCFKKSPPKERVEGKTLINPHNIPESDWKDPSPIRMKNPLVNSDDLLAEVEELNPSDPNINEKLTNIYKSLAKIRDKAKKSKIEAAIKKTGIASKTELNAIAKEAKELVKEEIQEEILQEAENQGTVKEFGGCTYLKTDYGYAIIGFDKKTNEPFEKPLCNFHIELKKCVATLAMNDTRPTSIYEGFIVCKGHRTIFEISSEDWQHNQKLAIAISKSAGPRATFSNRAVDSIRIAVSQFEQEAMVSTKKYKDHGYDDYFNPTLYRSINFNITPNGFDDNTDDAFVVESNGFERDFGLRSIKRSELADVIMAIKLNYLEFNEPKIMYTMLAHTLQASIQGAYFGFFCSPVLWLHGLTGSGKSVPAQFSQYFYGTFRQLLNVSTSAKSIESHTMMFKDSMLVIDDYKGNTTNDGISELLQRIYDQSSRGKLRRDSSQGAAYYCRGLVLITAEDPPTSEASTISRCILIETTKIINDDPKSNERFHALHAIKDKFSGVTAHFIHYVMSTYPDPEVLRNKFRELCDEVKDPIRTYQNSNRVAQNMAGNYLTWELFCDFMYENRFVTREEFEEYKNLHWYNITQLALDMCIACNQEQASNIVLAQLQSSLARQECYLQDDSNSRTAPNARSICLGFIKAPYIYLDPKTAVSIVKSSQKGVGSGLSHTTKSIGKQLLQDKVLAKVDPGALTVHGRMNGVQSRFWCLFPEKIGLKLGPHLVENEATEDEIDITNFLKP